MLRYDGLYTCQQNGTVRCLRFFEADRLVLYLSTQDSVQQVAWLLTPDRDLAKGTYKIDGNHLSFSIFQGDVQIDFECELKDQELNCNTFSHYNGNRASCCYQFVAMELDK